MKQRSLPHRVRRLRRSQLGKYNNQRIIIDGITFASLAEGARYVQLKRYADRGIIQHLQIHPRYRLQPPFVDRLGRSHRGITYTADFAYVIVEGEYRRFIVEDVKGPIERDYRLRIKLLMFRYPQLEFYEVDARRYRRTER